MQLLCLNCGGSSMKYQLLRMPEEEVLIKGGIDRLFTPRAEFKFKMPGKEERRWPIPGATFASGIQYLVDILRQEGLISNTQDIAAVVHKLAHGGEKFKEPTLISEEMIANLEELYLLAPVHLPPAVEGIRVCQRLMPGVPQYAVFETNFHQTVPPYAYIYGLPYEWYEQYGIRKYGFHGTSHRYVSEEAARILGCKVSELKIISCHLGSGTSVAAIKQGRSVDISSGLTPQSGTIMSTRPGDFDPWVLPMVMARTNMTVEEVSEVLVRQGGLLGISGLSGDMRDLEEAASQGHARARLAIEVFCYQVKKYIGAFAAVMNGLDVLVFTGGIGEKSPRIRAKVCEDMDFLGIRLDQQKNENPTSPGIISPEGAPVAVMVIATNEELMVARQVFALIKTAAQF
ncbi:acetate kinase [Thermanaeromonas toyohensis ToBE]|uniref:Acetate kinase n=1 Tax=Thermanaeromonas toyohensis ToBE TaxID=698762 RepID=A0A1W1VCB7_9FIRM|nr:acetate kinase [Thermanaeromonas toyohensis]SMB90965.1 acetate kinase [Thermanaeromonas toyohensis ToBE]